MRPTGFLTQIKAMTSLNPYIALGLSVLGMSQAVFWSFASFFPKSLYFFVDATFLAAFYFDVLGRTLLGYIGANLIFLPIVLVIWQYPLCVFRKLYFRTGARTIVKHQTEIRFFIFVISVILAFWGGLGWLIGLAGMLIGVISILYLRLSIFSVMRHRDRDKAVMERALELRARLSLISGDSVEVDEFNHMKKELGEIEQHFKENSLSRLRRKYRGTPYKPDMRAILTITAFLLLSLFCGAGYALQAKYTGEEVFLVDQQTKGVIIGRSADYLILYNQEADMVSAYSLGEIGAISFTE